MGGGVGAGGLGRAGVAVIGHGVEAQPDHRPGQNGKGGKGKVKPGDHRRSPRLRQM